MKRTDAGFTLIEVLVAMVILSIGLLGLEALGIGVVRAIARADRQSEYTAAASRYLEDAQSALRRGTMPPAACGIEVSSRATVSRTVTRVTPRLYRVTVAVNGRSGTPAPVLFSTRADVLAPPTLSSSGTTC